MEADTLKIEVFEHIKVVDVIVRAVKRLFDKIKQVFALFSQPEPKEIEEEQDSERGPPDLSIDVAEEIKSSEALHS